MAAGLTEIGLAWWETPQDAGDFDRVLRRHIRGVQIRAGLFAILSALLAGGFVVYGGRLFRMLRRFPVESRGRRAKLREVGYVTVVVVLSLTLRAAADVADALFPLGPGVDDPGAALPTAMYYVGTELFPAALVLFILRKLPPRRRSGEGRGTTPSSDDDRRYHARRRPEDRVSSRDRDYHEHEEHEGFEEHEEHDHPDSRRTMGATGRVSTPVPAPIPVGLPQYHQDRSPPLLSQGAVARMPIGGSLAADDLEVPLLDPAVRELEAQRTQLGSPLSVASSD